MVQDLQDRGNKRRPCGPRSRPRPNAPRKTQARELDGGEGLKIQLGTCVRRRPIRPLAWRVAGGDVWPSRVGDGGKGAGRGGTEV